MMFIRLATSLDAKIIVGLLGAIMGMLLFFPPISHAQHVRADLIPLSNDDVPVIARKFLDLGIKVDRNALRGREFEQYGIAQAYGKDFCSKEKCLTLVYRKCSNAHCPHLLAFMSEYFIQADDTIAIGSAEFLTIRSGEGAAEIRVAIGLDLIAAY